MKTHQKKQDAEAHNQAPETLDDKKARALDTLLDAWEVALDTGIEPDILAGSAIFAALTDMVENHGEEFVAQMAQTLPARIRSGEFTLVHEPN